MPPRGWRTTASVRCLVCSEYAAEYAALRTGIFVPLEGGIRVSDLYFNRSQVEVDGRQIRGFVALPDAVLPSGRRVRCDYEG